MRIGTGLLALLLLFFGLATRRGTSAQSRSGSSSLGVEDGLPPAGYPWFCPKALSNRNGLAFLLDGSYGDLRKLIAVQNDRAELVGPNLDGLEEGCQICFQGGSTFCFALKKHLQKKYLQRQETPVV